MEEDFIRVRISKDAHRKLTPFIRYDKKMYQLLDEAIECFVKSKKK
jgi:hypothetical protein